MNRHPPRLLPAIATLLFLAGCKMITGVVLWSTVAIVGIAILPLYPFMDYDERQEKNGVINATPIPNTSEYLVTFREGPRQDLYHVIPEDDTVKRITKNQAFIGNTRILSDGKTIIYVHTSKPGSRKSTLRELDLRTGIEKILVDNSELLGSPALLVAEEKIIFTQKDRTYYHLYTVDRETLEIQQLTQGEFGDLSPIPLDDGEHVVFQRRYVRPKKTPEANRGRYVSELHRLNLQDHSIERIVELSRYEPLPVRRIGNAYQLGHQSLRFMTPDGTLTPRRELYARFRKRHPDLGYVHKTDVLPDFSNNKILYAVTHKKDDERDTEFFRLNTTDDTLQNLGTIPFHAQSPNYNPWTQEFHFSGPDPTKLYLYQTETQTLRQITIKALATE